ncbi:hypothetical protein WA158_000690 [Blastocystis sp. Blastoise]
MEENLERRFWGLHLAANSAIELDMKSCEIHVSNAALIGPIKGITTLKIAMGNNEYSLCILSKETPQITLDMTVYPSEEAIFFLVEGENSIDVTGQISIDLNDDEEDMEGEEEEDGENDQVVEVNKKNNNKKDNKKKDDIEIDKDGMDEFEDEEIDDDDEFEEEEEIDDDDEFEDEDNMFNDIFSNMDDDDEYDDDDEIEEEEEEEDVSPKSSVIVEEIKDEEEKEEEEVKPNNKNTTQIIEKKETIVKEIKDNKNEVIAEQKVDIQTVVPETKTETSIPANKETKSKEDKAMSRKQKKLMKEDKLHLKFLQKKKEATEFPVRMINKNCTYKDITIGKGKKPAFGHLVQIDYSCTLPDGTLVEQSEGQNYKYRVGIKEINDLLDKTVQSMKEGGERKVVLHPAVISDLHSQHPNIPKDSKVIYKVKLNKCF